jgi:hypothetical protein
MELGGRFRSTTHMGEVELGHMSQDHGNGQMLRHEIGAVVLARNLCEGTIFFAHCSWSQRQFTSM